MISLRTQKLMPLLLAAGLPLSWSAQAGIVSGVRDIVEISEAGQKAARVLDEAARAERALAAKAALETVQAETRANLFETALEMTYRKAKGRVNGLTIPARSELRKPATRLASGTVGDRSVEYARLSQSLQDQSTLESFMQLVEDKVAAKGTQDFSSAKLLPGGLSPEKTAQGEKLLKLLGEPQPDIVLQKLRHGKLRDFTDPNMRIKLYLRSLKAKASASPEELSQMAKWIDELEGLLQAPSTQTPAEEALAQMRRLQLEMGQQAPKNPAGAAVSSNPSKPAAPTAAGAGQESAPKGPADSGSSTAAR